MSEAKPPFGDMRDTDPAGWLASSIFIAFYEAYPELMSTADAFAGGTSKASLQVSIGGKKFVAIIAAVEVFPSPPDPNHHKQEPSHV